MWILGEGASVFAKPFGPAKKALTHTKLQRKNLSAKRR